jgi:lycopene beta-cyclase
VLREESGVLPVVLSGDIDALWRETADVARAGLRAGLFHPTTGYSFPYAVRTAEVLAASDMSAGGVYRRLRDESSRAWASGAFFRGLNRMLFLAAPPTQRYRILERFYTLPEPLIARFYAGRLTKRDQARILFGVPPVPVASALRALLQTRAGRSP